MTGWILLLLLAAPIVAATAGLVLVARLIGDEQAPEQSGREAESPATGLQAIHIWSYFLRRSRGEPRRLTFEHTP
jgi:hypothetical protein